MAPKINQVTPDQSTNNENLPNQSIDKVSSKGESKFKKAVNDIIAKTAIALSVTGGAVAPEVATSTIVPEAVATITTMAPTTGTTLKAIALGTSGAILAACEDPDEIGPNIKIPDEILKSGISIEKPEILSNNGTTIRLGNIEVAVCSDESGMGAVTVNVNGKIVKKGESITIDKSCSATINAADTHGNPSSKTFRINYIDTSPEYISYKTEVPVSQGDKITRNNGEIFAGTEKTFAFNSDEYTISLKLGKGDKYEDITNHLPFSLDEVGDRNLEQTLISKKNGKSKSRTTTIKVSEVDNNQPPEVTREYPQDKVPNILGGVTVKGDNNQLTFGDVVMYTGKDDNTPVCTISLKLKGSDEEKVGKKISESNTYVLRYIDKDGKSSSPTEFSVKSESIDLTNLNLNMQVNQEVDLLEGIKTPSGIEITKVEVEINGQRQEVKAKNGHYLYTPKQPGTCYIYVTEKGEFGNTYVEKSKNPLTIKALEYKEPTINTANIINEKYSWYNNLSQEVKDFIYPHLLASYAACNRSEQSNRVHIIMGETTNANGVENIGQRTDRSDHAKEGSHRIRVLCPDVSIKACHDLWGDLEKYIEQHPNEFFVISCAAGSGGGGSRSEFKDNPETAPEERLLKNKKVIIICSAGNWAQVGWKMYNENIKDGNRYNPSSLNSTLNNKITVFGYVEGRSDNYFSPDATVYGGVKSAMPVGYKKSEGNLVMPMISLIASNGQSDYSTNSSYPTAVASGVVGNAVSLVMSNNSGITPADAMTIIGDDYLNKKTFQYKDETTNGELVDGVDGYSIDMQKLLKNELLQSSKIDKLQFNKDEIELPSGPGLCIIGRGVMFEYKGKRYSTTDTNQSLLIQALKSGNVKYIWSKDLYTEQGGSGSVKIDVYVVDKDANKLPDLHKVIERNIN